MESRRFSPGTILTGISGGSLSDHAVTVSVDLANRLGASLELLHAVPVPTLLGTRFDSSQVAAMTAEHVGLARERILAHLAQNHPGATVAGTPLGELVHVASGPPPKVVLDRARTAGADLLVLGESGKSKNMDFGGVARALLSKSPCPIWVQSSRPTPVEHVLAPVDLSEHSMEALSAAVDLAGKLGAEVTALHCFAVQDYAYTAIPYGAGYAGMPSVQGILESRREHFLEQMDAFDWRGVKHRTVFADDEASRGILRRQEEHDLIVMGTHGRTGLAATLLGGVAYRVLRAAYRPVLAIRQPERSWLL